MRSAARLPGKATRFWGRMGWLTVLAAVAVVALGALADAAERRSRGVYSAKPWSSQRAVRNRASRTRSVRPSRVQRARPPRAHPVRPTRAHRVRPTRPTRGEAIHKPPRVKYPPRGSREATHPPRQPRHPRHPRHPRGPDIPAVVIPGIIGVIGTIAPEPVRPEPVYESPPPSRRPPSAASRRPPSSPPPSPLPPQRPTSIAGSGVPPAGEQRLVPDEVVVQLPPGASQQAIADIEARHQLARLETQTFLLTGESMVRWRIPDQRSVTAVIIALEADAGVSAAQPNYLFALSQATTGLSKGDPAQYAVGKLHLPEAHQLARGDKVLIGVVDSGIDAGHPELAGMIAESFDTLPGEDAHSHGTAIAGTIVAHARLLGVAPASRILAARAFGAKAATAQATTFNILKSIDWAARNGARIINMSFAGPRDPAIERQLAAADKRNVVLIAAAGNAGPTSPPLYPAADRHVIAVAATDARDRLFDRSNRGSHITISAPGVDIIAPAPRGAYQITSGTSIAAAYVSGLAALLIERSPDMTPTEVRRVLQATARDLGKRGHDQEFGAGLADAYRALQSVQPPRAVDALTSRRR